jgi:DNA gyrase subunit B
LTRRGRAKRLARRGTSCGGRERSTGAACRASSPTARSGILLSARSTSSKASQRGSAKQGRDRRFQAILPIKGKILNVEKARFDKMLSSDEIKTMIAALGCGIGSEDFDADKLRYHRVIIMTDADVDGSHIRTLLLTFFYRQMYDLIDRGHIYIAQPPLFRAKRGRTETYIKNEQELEAFLVRRAVESRVVKLADGSEMFGEVLERQLQRSIAYRKLLLKVTRRGHPPAIVSALIEGDARDKSFFEHRERLDVIAARMTTPTTTVSVFRDDEHNVFALRIDDRSQGYPRQHELGVDFITSGEYRTLAAAYREIQDIKFPVVVSSGEPSGDADGETVDEGASGGEDATAPAGAPATSAAASRARKEPDVRLESLDAFVEFFITSGKRGVAVNRYKGLGEMNPETLWTTTMDPDNRTLLQVRAEDHAEADQMFTTLMGDQVEPRRKFIEDNALDVRNLDV